MKRLLIANRGEIVRRIIRTSRKLNIETVAIYSDADRGRPFTYEADFACALGGRASTDSYLSIEKILRIAKRMQADAVHPGYGFLAENAEFASRVIEAGLIFVGPTPESMRLLGDKAEARRLAESLGVSIPQGYHGSDQSVNTLLSRGEELGFPLMIKAAAGGGGRGLRQISRAEDFPKSLELAKREAEASFLDGTLILERAIRPARHIEVQIVGDGKGDVIHLYERDCSLQRRHQKVIEEAPAPNLDSITRKELLDAAIKLGKAAKLKGVATVEFLVSIEPSTKSNKARDWFFMEVNPRLQVEHPVTEMITGIDIVELQLRIAQGKKLPIKQNAVKIHGHAIEARVYAEQPEKDFLPSVGQLYALSIPESDSNNVRIEHDLAPGTRVTTDYDAMIAKCIAWDTSREKATSRLSSRLSHCFTPGVRNNTIFLRTLCNLDAFSNATFSTQSLEALALQRISAKELHEQATLAACCYHAARLQRDSSNPDAFSKLRYRKVSTADSFRTEKFLVTADGEFEAQEIEITTKKETPLFPHKVFLAQSECSDGTLGYVCMESGSFHIASAKRSSITAGISNELGDEIVRSPLPGTITQVHVKEGDTVTAGQTLMTLESMKMQHAITAVQESVIQRVHSKVGNPVQAGTMLIELSCKISR